MVKIQWGLHYTQKKSKPLKFALPGNILFCKEMLILDSINFYSNDRVEQNTYLKSISNYDHEKKNL